MKPTTICSDCGGEHVPASVKRAETPLIAQMTTHTQLSHKIAPTPVKTRLRAILVRPVHINNDAFEIGAAFDPLAALADNNFAALTDYLFSAGDEKPLPAVDAKTVRGDLKARGIYPHVPSGKLFRYYGFGSLISAVRCQLRHGGAVVVSLDGIALVGVPLPEQPTQLALEVAA